MTQALLLCVIFIFQTDPCDGNGSEVDFVPHAFHAVIADLVRIKVAAVTFAAAVADLVIIQQALSLLAHALSPPASLYHN